jgi:hypothetical protein
MSHYDNLINLGNWLKSLNRLHHYSKGQFPLLLRSLLDHWDSWLHSVSLIISVECLITMLVQYVWGGGDDTKSLPGRGHWSQTLGWDIEDRYTIPHEPDLLAMYTIIHNFSMHYLNKRRGNWPCCHSFYWLSPWAWCVS